MNQINQKGLKVSIAVPSLNYGRFLPACLDSCAAQTYGNIEILIADGGSSDDSMDIIERYCAQDPRFRLVSRTDRGQADAINRALQQATGDIACFLNADDLYIRNDVMAQVVSTFETDATLGLLSMGGEYVDAAGKTIRPVKLRYHPLDSHRWMKWRTAVLQPATFWRASISKEHPFCEKFHFVFDVEFFWYAYQHYRWREVPLPAAGYRLHGANKSTSVREDRIREMAEMERIKFGERSLRARYLDGVAGAVAHTGEAGRRVIYNFVNSLSFLSSYCLPGI
jgi:glycosyltransferase involved in cell wall biosynthesis